MPTLSSLIPSMRLPRGGRRGPDVVGLDIQPGYVAAVQAHVNGGIVVERAAGAALPPDAVREGEVLDERALGETLGELFSDGRLGKRVRVGLANQRTVLRTLELPPVTDRKELAAAVRFQAEDQVPMPLAGAVLDFHSLGVHDTPEGPRQRVIVVAAQREMVERLLRAVRHAGLRPEGVDLSAFALIRSLYHADAAAAAQQGAEQAERVLYLNVGGLTNMAIAEGPICRFTRVVGGGLEAMASEVAERRGIPLVEARALLAAFELNAPAAVPPPASAASATAPSAADHGAQRDMPPAGFGQGPGFEQGAGSQEGPGFEDGPGFQEGPSFGGAPGADAGPERVETWALAQEAGGAGGEESASAARASAARAAAQSAAESAERQGATPSAARGGGEAAQRSEAARGGDPEVRMVLENGIREIVGEVRNSLDFHRSQEGGGEVQRVVLSGPALEMRGFSEALEADLGMAVRRETVRFAAGQDSGGVSAHHLAIATGLAAEEAPR
jgi:type IV pilus assembly protein PilM